MQTRRDHLQAYQFSTSRLVVALASGDPGTGQTPFRRARLGVLVGVVLGVLISGGMVVSGLIAPEASTAWRNPNTIIVAKETGTRYLLLDGVLHPTANYASAVLVAGQTASVQIVPQAQLAGVPTGPTVGIPGAPDILPPAAGLLPGTWALCQRPGSRGVPVLDLDPAGRTSAIPARESVVVAGPAAGSGPGAPAPTEFVLWDGTKYPVTEAAMLPALGLSDASPAPVSAAWLAAFPTGPALAPAAVAGAGSAGSPVAGQPARVGQLFEVPAADPGQPGTEQYYVLLKDGLAPLTRTEAALLGGEPGGAGARQVDAAAVAAAPASADHSLLQRLPDLLGAPIRADDHNVALCALQSSPGDPAGTELVAEDGAAIAAAPPVVLPDDRGMLAQGGPTLVDDPENSPPEYLITGTGEKFVIQGTDAAAALGYPDLAARIVTPQMLALIPTGPTLSTAAALKAAA